MSGLFIVLGLIALFLIGTFAYSYRLLKIQSRRDQNVDPKKLREWKDED